MARDIRKIRNIGIIAHIDAGKTTVTERMLFFTGSIHRMGDVDKGTTETDFDPEEQQRGITIYSACVTFPWKDVIVNLIDTPGHVDFTAEVERSLRVLDGAVVVLSAREGVEAQSETVWRQADKYLIPRIAFINKMDREGASFDEVLREMNSRLGAKPVAINIPVGSGPPHVPEGFRGIIDLIEMKYLTFDQESRGKEMRAEEIPSELSAEADLWRGQMLEQLFDYSNELAELVLEEAPVPSELIRSVLRDATLHNLIVPTMCGSALDCIGIQPVLDGVGHYLPCPLDRPPVEGPSPQKPDKIEKRAPDNDAPFCGLVFKVIGDRHGDLHYVRVYSGTLKAGTRVLNPGKEKKENVAQLWHVQADSREQIPSVEAGDIVGVIGLRHSITGDTLCQPQHPILLESIVFPETVISMAIEPESTGERKKLADVLEMMKRQDPTFRAVENEETGQTLISGMGELHLEVIKHRLLRDFNLDVKVHQPRVNYRETIGGTAVATGECNRQIAGTQLFAKMTIEMSPLEGGSTDNKALFAAGEGFPKEWAPIAVEELQGRLEGGGLYGNPLIRVQARILEGEFSETETTEAAVRIAVAEAFEQGLRQAGCVLLEPIMNLEVTVPEENMGDFVGDLQQRRAVITKNIIRGSMAVITAEVPLRNLFGYSTAMRGMSQGRATCSMEPSDYGAAPEEVVRTMV